MANLENPAYFRAVDQAFTDTMRKFGYSQAERPPAELRAFTAHFIEQKNFRLRAAGLLDEAA